MMSLFISSCVIGLDGSLRVNVNSVPVSGGRISDGQLCLTEGTLTRHYLKVRMFALA